MKQEQQSARPAFSTCAPDDLLPRWALARSPDELTADDDLPPFYESRKNGEQIPAESAPLRAKNTKGKFTHHASWSIECVEGEVVAEALPGYFDISFVAPDAIAHVYIQRPRSRLTILSSASKRWILTAIANYGWTVAQ